MKLLSQSKHLLPGGLQSIYKRWRRQLFFGRHSKFQQKSILFQFNAKLVPTFETTLQDIYISVKNEQSKQSKNKTVHFTSLLDQRCSSHPNVDLHCGTFMYSLVHFAWLHKHAYIRSSKYYNFNFSLAVGNFTQHGLAGPAFIKSLWGNTYNPCFLHAGATSRKRWAPFPDPCWKV